MTDPERGIGYQPLRYHEATKHSPASVRSGTHRVDWMDQPEPFKTYPGLEGLPLPAPAPDTGHPSMQALLGRPGKPRKVDLPELSRLVTLAAGVRRVRRQPVGKPVHYRTYASAGALYPIEVYLACNGVPGLDAGTYHYSPRDNTLRLIRPGDPRPWLLRACGYRPSVGRAPLTAILTGIPWRTNWKYRARGYRHVFWDAGMVVANLLALAASGGHASEVLLGFVDSELDALVGIDGHEELSVCLVPIGFPANGPHPEPAASAPPPVSHETGKVSFRQREFPEAMEAHQAAELRSPVEAQLWQQQSFPSHAPPPADVSFSGIERVIRRRGSKRAFSPEPVPKEELEGILGAATYDLACDWGEGLTQFGLIANAVEDLAPGAYAAVWNLDPVALGELREKASFLCLEQELGGDAAATVFLLADLEEASRVLGPRSYRAAQLDAGITGGRIYLGAYACGFGATGLTFYDDEVRTFFKTQAEPMLAMALGR